MAVRAVLYVASGDDDADSGGGWDTTDVNLAIGRFVGTAYNTYSRWLWPFSIASSRIIHAYVRFRSSTSVGSPTVTLRLINDAGASPPFVNGMSQYSAGSQPPTIDPPAGISWTPATWTDGVDYDSPDILSFVTYWLDTLGGVAGNYLGIACVNATAPLPSGFRTASSGDEVGGSGNGSIGPRLIIEYTGRKAILVADQGQVC